MENRDNVQPELAHDIINNIRILALNGKKNFRKYLFDPLYGAGWYNKTSSQNTGKLIERIKKQASDPSFIHTIAPQCKRIICYAMAEGFSALGNSSIFFLENIQGSRSVALSPEALEFTGIVSPPLREFMVMNSENNEQLFLEAVSTASEHEILTAFEPVKLDTAAEKVKLDGEIKRLYNNIQIASKYQNLPKCRKLLSTYIIKYGDNDDYARSDVDRLIDALTKREPGFDTELKSAMATDLYYRIRKSVHEGDIKTTIQSIRKYGYIFEGDPDTKHFYDIDRLERILYKLITEKDLWKELKKEQRGE